MLFSDQPGISEGISDGYFILYNQRFAGMRVESIRFWALAMTVITAFP
jgi:hypothetical protein